LDAKTKEFKDADMVPGGVFLNIGDLLQMWSGDKLPATVRTLYYLPCWKQHFRGKEKNYNQLLLGF
jgi:hypothetical protein